MARDLPPAPPADKTETAQDGPSGNFLRVAKFTLLRLLALFVTVIVGIYLVVLIANMGGHVDDIRRAQIKEAVGMMMLGMQEELAQMTTEERRQYETNLIRIQEERLGLDRPFMVRSFIYLKNAIFLDLGRAEQMTSDKGSREVRNIILERLPPTLFLFLTAYIVNFFIALFFALFLSRRYGSRIDKAVIALAPTSAAPGWFYGVFLILIFAAILGVLPFGGMVKAPPPAAPLAYALSVLRHLILPVSAMIISSVFINIYSWRTFFLIYSSEDYVEMAKAKGLSPRAIERKYVLRPTLPPIITAFALSLIYQWMGGIILETVFNWPGLGRLIFSAIGSYDIPIIVGSQVIFAYLLAFTVFILDFVYALIDPRVKVGGEEGSV